MKRANYSSAPKTPWFISQPAAVTPNNNIALSFAFIARGQSASWSRCSLVAPSIVEHRKMFGERNAIKKNKQRGASRPQCQMKLQYEMTSLQSDLLRTGSWHKQFKTRVIWSQDVLLVSSINRQQEDLHGSAKSALCTSQLHDAIILSI